MKSHDNLIEQLADLGVFITHKEMGSIRKAVMRDRKIDKKLKKRKAKTRMIAELRINDQ